MQVIQFLIVFFFLSSTISLELNLRECDSTHDMVGCTTELVGYQHDVGGEVTIEDDCTFSVNITYDGQGGDYVGWYWAPSDIELIIGLQVYYIEGSDKFLADHGPWKDEVVEIQLGERTTWGSIGVLAFGKDSLTIFGQADLTEC